MIVSASLLALLACSSAPTTDTDDRRGDGSTNGAELVLENPQPGSEFDAGAAIPLDVSATKDGRDLTPQDVTWTIGTWSGEGAHTSAPGLSAGEYVVGVRAIVDGETLEASAAIRVLPTELTYNGTLDATATLTTDFGDLDASCSGPISFTAVRRTGSLDGGGTITCSSDFGDESVYVGLTGTFSDGDVNGEMDVEGNRTAFRGSGTFGEAMTADFDGTFSNSDGSLRLQGTWSAAPQ
jgi:hypothetical protein